MDYSSISELLGQYKDLLMPWPDIMAAALFGKQPASFLPLKSSNDFIDGIQLVVPAHITGGQLQRLLKEQGLDVFQPHSKNRPGSWWL